MRGTSSRSPVVSPERPTTRSRRSFASGLSPAAIHPRCSRRHSRGAPGPPECRSHRIRSATHACALAGDHSSVTMALLSHERCQHHSDLHARPEPGPERRGEFPPTASLTRDSSESRSSRPRWGSPWPWPRVEPAKPGGSVTGLAALAPELKTKRLELLKDVVPRLSHVAVLVNP